MKFSDSTELHGTLYAVEDSNERYLMLENSLGTFTVMQGTGEGSTFEIVKDKVRRQELIDAINRFDNRKDAS